MTVTLRGAAATAFTSLAASALLGGAAFANDPSFRYCEAGYVNEDVGLSGQSSGSSEDGDFTAALSSDDGSGFRGACTVQLLGGLFVHGEYQQANFDVDAAFSGAFDEAFSGDVDSTSLRIGAGLALDVPFLPIVGYGQVSYTQVEFDGDLQSVVDDASDATALIDTDDSGFDLEVGARGLVFENLDIGAFLRYTDVGSISIPEEFDEIENDDDIRIGAQAALKIFGPAWATLRYEAGDTDALFVGLRAAL